MKTIQPPTCGHRTGESGTGPDAPHTTRHGPAAAASAPCSLRQR